MEITGKHDEICAWCGVVIRKNVPGIQETTHGICKKCYKKQIKDIEEKEKKSS
jgi:hypothetical protein